MNEQYTRINCTICRKATDLEPDGYYDDGSQRLLFACCKRDGGVVHRCSHDYAAASPIWLPLLLAGIGIVCPECKKTYDFGLSIEPTYPEAGQALEAVGLFVGTLLLVGVLGDILNGRRPRRRD